MKECPIVARFALVAATVAALTATGGAAQSTQTRRTTAMAWAPGAHLVLDAATPAWADPSRLFVRRRNRFEIVGPEVNAGIASSPGDGPIAIASTLDLYAIRPDGTGLQRLARNATQADAWSPDGRRLLFDSGDGYLYVVGRDGRGRRRLALINSNFESHAVWSPDGRSVAFQACRPGRDPDLCDAGQLDVFVIGANGNRLRRITARSLGDQCLLSWAPAHDIAYGRSRLTVVATPTGNVTRRIPGFTCASWSPDAKRLLGFSHSVPAIARAEGGAATPVVNFRNRTVLGEGPAVPVWSPDGTQVAFSRVYASNGAPLSHEYVVDLRTHHVRMLP